MSDSEVEVDAAQIEGADVAGTEFAGTDVASKRSNTCDATDGASSDVATAALLTEDISARQSAIDVRGSYLVQAPAGSGKTELLTQRLLALLGQATETPEAILAITFTNKSAAEMRQRVFESLWRANTAPEPDQEPDKTNWRLARQVLARSKKAGWHLLENPGRLRIMTIDALCGSIAQQLPLLSEFGSQPKISDQPERLYQDAAQNALAYWSQQPSENDDASADAAEPLGLGLLLRVENDVVRLVNLLTQMLATRDQWLPHIVPTATDAYAGGADQLLALLDKSLDHLIQTQLQQAKKLLAAQFSDLWPAMRDSLVAARQGFALLGVDGKQAKPNSLAYAFSQFDDDAFFTASRVSDLSAEDPAPWLALVTLLTTGDAGKRTWRKPRGVTKALGFPAASAGSNAAEKTQIKENKAQFQALLEALEGADALLAALNQISLLPPRRLPAGDQALLRQLMDLLVLAVGFLKMSFQAAGQVDFCEVSLGAMRALADTSESDAAIEAANQYQHILVDEFQDTSVTQYHLLGHLVGDWQTEDVPDSVQPPTLFLVGDPMQSIYRFRQAEVGLFLQVKQQGIGPIKLQYLRLTRNFRSDPAVVNWVNQHFDRIFPAEESVTQGRVSYSASLAGRKPGSVLSGEPELGIHMDWQGDDESVVTACVQQIASAREASPEATVAILVRGRRHLRQLLPALAQVGLAYEAVEARALVGEPIVQDLLALTTIIAQPEEGLAWASVLRSPICGLDLNDLLALYAGQPGRTPWPMLKRVFEDPTSAPTLSLEGHRLIRRIVVPLAQVIEDFAYVPLMKKVRWAAWALGLLQQVSPEAEDCVEAFWQALEKYAQSATVFSATDFTEQLSATHGSVLATDNNPIQIMTIHKSKGLEFDHVFIPFAEKTGALDDNPLLQVQPVVFEDGEGLLMAALPDRVEDVGPQLYQYLRYLNREKGLQELKRVLYVAVTRGKKSVTLVSKISVDAEQETYRSARGDAFLSSLMDSLSAQERTRLAGFVGDQSARMMQDAGEAEAANTTNEEEKPWLLSAMPLNADVSRLAPEALLPWEQVIAQGHETAFWSQALAEWAGPNTLIDPFKGECPEAWRRKRGNSTAATGELLAEIVAKPDDTERLCGTYLHNLLEANRDVSALAQLAERDWETDAEQWFASQGLDDGQIMQCCERLMQCLDNLMMSERGQWIMAARDTTRVEWPLSVVQVDGVKHLRIDRCFFEDDAFWIIDFKLSHWAHHSDTEILAHYGDQLRGYVEAVKSGWGNGSDADLDVRFGIYFPETDRWVSG